MPSLVPPGTVIHVIPPVRTGVPKLAKYAETVSRTMYSAREKLLTAMRVGSIDIDCKGVRGSG
jgi:hypothetical protein